MNHHPLLEELVANGLVRPAWLTRMGEGYRDRAERHLSGIPGQWTERNVTDFMTLTDGELERVVIEVLCRAAEVGARPGYQIISGEWFAASVPRTHAKDARNVDLVIGEWLEDEGIWRAVVAIEAKFGASVNGDWYYCKNPDHDNVYSNQVICYPRGCTHQELGADRIPFVWLSAAAWPSSEGIPTALRPRDVVKEPRWAQAFEEQSVWSQRWKHATWADLLDAVAKSLAPFGPQVVHAAERAFTNESGTRSGV